MAKVRKASQEHKIKLKVGKRLSKGDTVTKTSFKAKKIKIGGKRTFGDSVEPKQVISQLLSNLHLDPSPIKLNKLQKLQRIILAENEFISASLNQILNKIAGLILNNEPSIRKQCMKLLRLILQELTKTDRCPHYAFLKSLARSAMTHIDENIRYDSLSILQLFLDYLPQVVVSSHSLFNTMLTLISTRSKMGTSTSRALISPGTKTGTLEWRKTVLKYLVDYLQANIAILGQINVEKLTEFTVKIKKKEYTLIKYHTVHSDLAMKNYSHDSNEINFNFNLEEFKKFITNILPILHDSWLEYAPSVYSSKIGTTASLVHSEAMFCILQVLSYIFEWLNHLTGRDKLKDILQHQCGNDLMKKIVSTFPYSSENVHSTLVLKINFALCKLLNQFPMKRSKLNKKMLQFLSEQLHEMKGTKTDSLDDVLQILEGLLSHEINSLECNNHLDKLYDLYSDLPSSNQCRKEVQAFLTKLSVEMEFDHLHGNVVLHKWWRLLPLEFILNASESFNEADRDFFEQLLPVCDQNGEFVAAVNENINEIISLVESSNEFVRFTAVAFISTLDPITKDHFVLLTNVLRKEMVTTDLIESLFISLINRNKTKNSGFFLKDLISFIVNLAFGPLFHDHELTECAEFCGLMHVVPFGLSTYTIVLDKKKTRKSVTDLAINYLHLLHEPQAVHSFICQYLQIFLQKPLFIPVDSALVALKFASIFLLEQASDMFPEEFLLQIGELAVACYLFAIAAKTACNDNKELAIDWQNIIKSLKQDTYDIGFVFKVLLNNASIMSMPNFLFCIGQLLVQLVGASNFKPQDINELCAVLKTLKTMHGKQVTEQKWWSQMRMFLQHISNSCNNKEID